MTNEEALEYAKIEYELFPEDNEYLLNCIEAIEKQIPKKPKQHEEDEYSARCPDCGCEVPTHWVHGGVSHCECCGQAILWEE